MCSYGKGADGGWGPALSRIWAGASSLMLRCGPRLPPARLQPVFITRPRAGKKNITNYPDGAVETKREERSSASSDVFVSEVIRD